MSPGAGAPFRILSVDGGGIRGLIAARVIARLEQLVSAEAGQERRIADCFQLLAGTSTGGLLALGLAAPRSSGSSRPRLSGEDLASFYVDDGPAIFHVGLLRRLLTGFGWLGPRYSADELERVLRDRIGDARLSEALREVVVTSYDMAEPGPHFFKRWRARDSPDRDVPMIDAALATAAAPTYFPSHGVGSRALVDGGVFSANPTVAAVVEALKRVGEGRSALTTDDLLVVSLGTGQHQTPYEQRRVRRWGQLGWILPRDGEPPLVAAFLDGQSDAADHWSEILLNHEPGAPLPDAGQMGRGPRYYRFQIALPPGFGLDDASSAALRGLDEAAERLLEERAQDLEDLARRLAAIEPLAPDPAPAG